MSFIVKLSASGLAAAAAVPPAAFSSAARVAKEKPATASVRTDAKIRHFISQLLKKMADAGIVRQTRTNNHDSQNVAAGHILQRQAATANPPNWNAARFPVATKRP